MFKKKEYVCAHLTHTMIYIWDIYFINFSEPNSFKHVFNVTIPADKLAKNYDRLRQLLDESGYDKSILVGPEVNHVGEYSHQGEEYAELFLTSQNRIVHYVTWHQYYLNGREATVKDFIDPPVFNWLPIQIKSLGKSVAASGKNVSMWLCMYFILELERVLSCQFI